MIGNIIVGLKIKLKTVFINKHLINLTDHTTNDVSTFSTETISI